MTRIGPERTIAEILGWTYREVEFVEHDVVSIVVLPFGPDGERLFRPQGPTVDDLVEWLHSKRAFIDSIEPEAGLTPGADPADRWCVHVLYGDCLGDYFTGPTILAALEAAVRAVDSEATGTSE